MAHSKLTHLLLERVERLEQRLEAVLRRYCPGERPGCPSAGGADNFPSDTPGASFYSDTLTGAASIDFIPMGRK